MSTNVGVWIAAIGTLACYSYLYKDNLAYQIMEHVFIGISAAHAMVMGYQNIKTMAWAPMVKGNSVWAISMLLGLLLYTRFFKGYGWLSRYPLSFMMGIGGGVAFRGALDGQFVAQIRATMVPITNINQLLLFIGVVGSLTYFLFGPWSRTAIARHVSTIGIYTMMGAFGAAYGNTVMARMSLVIGRLQYLFGTWIPILPK
ncbi:MAG: hypothetical protein Q8P31_14195 [Bacillota bacterium]|nr:hypothetical protein [Bacillota bacterium]